MKRVDIARQILEAVAVKDGRILAVTPGGWVCVPSHRRFQRTREFTVCDCVQYGGARQVGEFGGLVPFG
mgnify:CR=1 FL=1